MQNKFDSAKKELLKQQVKQKIKYVPTKEIVVEQVIIETGNFNEPVIYVSEVHLVNYCEAPNCKQESTVKFISHVPK